MNLIKLSRYYNVTNKDLFFLLRLSSLVQIASSNFLLIYVFTISSAICFMSFLLMLEIVSLLERFYLKNSYENVSRASMTNLC